MDYSVLVNDNVFSIKESEDIIKKFKVDDEFLIQYVIKAIRKGQGQPVPASRRYNTSSQVSSSTDYSTGTKCEPSTTPESSRSSDSRYAYYQGPNLTPQRPLSQDRPDSAYRAQPPPPPPDTKNMQGDSRLFGLPPPPPPADPYPANMVPSPGYFLSNAAAYLFPVPTPPGLAPIGAGQYLAPQPGNYRLPQYHGEYGSGFSNRSGYNNHLNRKRNMPHEYDSDSPRKGSSKKKKKPLSQNMPSKKDWSLEDAKRALEVEREFNKRHKSPSLIIKFPDLELNRDIVNKFHSKIESVHFQQPSTPRFCFVTLKDSSCMEEVIQDLRKIKFGDGYLNAEPKNNKEEELVKGPEDIDPLTLYVGNLAQEVTVDDVVKAYPKHKRIDIGFAKKMKYTRYAFVCFRNADDAIDAFQNTHSTEMFNKSLIVRFRRLHGTVGLPGDPKQQNSQKRSENDSNNRTGRAYTSNLEKSVPRIETPPVREDCDAELSDDPDLETALFNDNEKQNRLKHYPTESSDMNMGSFDVKTEPRDYDFEDDADVDKSEKTHVPMINVKTEPAVKHHTPIMLEELAAKVKKEEPEFSSCTRTELFPDTDDESLLEFMEDLGRPYV